MRDKPKLFFFTNRKQFSDIFKTIETLPRNTVIIIREYDLEHKDRLLFAKKIVKIARENNLITLSGKSLELHLEAKTDGIHFSDNDISWRKYLNYKKNNSGLLLSCSCHDEKSLRKTMNYGINFLFLSPIFPTNSHPNSKTIGNMRLAKITRELGDKSPIYALGGINLVNIRLLKNTRIAGFGFITMVQK